MGQRPTVDNPSGPSPVTPELLLGTLPVLLLPLFAPKLDAGVAGSPGGPNRRPLAQTSGSPPQRPARSAMDMIASNEAKENVATASCPAMRSTPIAPGKKKPDR